MKRILYFVFWVIFCTSCGNFLEEYSQDLVYAQSCEDLDEILIGNGYMAQPTTPSYFSYGDKAFYYPYLHVMDDDIEEYLTGNANISSSINPVTTLRNFYIWAKEPFMRISGLTFRDYDWKRMYEHIGYLNVIISYVKEFHEDSEEMRHRILGEAQFLRAGYYFMLVNLYANPYSKETADATMGVPLNLTEYIEEGYFSRDPVAAVYRQIVTDLENAIVNLSGIKQPTIYRVNEKAARALLSRVYLYMQDWENAKSTAEKLLAQNGALLDYSSIAENTDGYAISEKSPELLFSQGPLNLQCEFSGSGGDFCVSNDLYKLYDENDYRQTIYFTRSTQSDSLGLNRKYQMGKHRSYVSDIFTLRTAEGYLNAAEACAMLGDAGAASGWLNRLRGKRIKDYEDVVYTADEIIEQVRVERRKELCLEGHRWLDLRRYAVCKKSPFKKIIERVYALYDWDGRSVFKYAEVYQLNVDDPAYVFAIPKAVLEFDKDMPDNIREDREYVRLMYRNNE